ncbi:MAG TPA: putative Ig domain-containing protein, partial [Opitutus sp.]|nr:putative Ig domain-containing protein [Opitutus sp.]
VPRNRIARLLADGRVDYSFSSDVNGQINALAVQPDGRIVIGGAFTAVNGTTLNRLARLNADGSPDTSFNPNLTGGLTPEVRAIALQLNGQIVVGGGFTTVQANGAAAPTTRNRIARFNADGSLDAAFNPNANGLVLSLAVEPDGQILVGGGFTSVHPNGAATATTRNRIARLNSDGTVDTTFDPNADNAVSAIQVLPDGMILIGGTFKTLKPNGTSTAVTTNVSRLARLKANGEVDTTFYGNVDGQVYTIQALPDGNILVGGAFASLGGGSRAYFGRLLPNGSLDTSFTGGANFVVYGSALQTDGSLVVGGGFTTFRGNGANAVVRNHVARVLPNGALDVDFRPDLNGRLRSVAVQSDGQILIGGTFTSLGGSTRQGFGRLKANGTLDTAFKPEVNGLVTVSAQQADGKLLIAGSFSRVNGVTRGNIARLNSDGSLDTAFDPATDSAISAVLPLSDGKILIGGAFGSVRPTGSTDYTNRPYIARLNADGTIDTSFDLGLNGAISALALQGDGKIVIAGQFTGLLPHGANRSESRLSIARINPDATLDTTFNPTINGTLIAVLIQSDGKIVVGGQFAQLAPNGSTTIYDRQNLVRLNADGTLDAGFDPHPNDIVLTLAQQSDGKLVVGGRFTTLDPGVAGTPVTRNYVARLDTDGKVDTGFDLQLDQSPGNLVASAVALPNNQLLVGGAFTALKTGGTPVYRNRLARVNGDGSVDTSFDADTGASAGAPVEVVTVQSDGRVLAAGTFAAFGGTNGQNFARFNLDSTPDTTFAPTLNGPVYALGQQLTKGEAVSTPKTGFAWLQNNGQLKSFTFPSDVTVVSVRTVAVQADGKVLIAGSFTVGSSSVRTNLLRFQPDGSLDTGFAINDLNDADEIDDTAAEVYVIQPLSDGKILIGGAFLSIGTTARANLARLNSDGSLDTSFTVATNSTVLAIAVQSDNKILIGGGFTTAQVSGANTSTARSYLARINTDSTVDNDFNPSPNASVQAIQTLADGKILIGGQFTKLSPNGASTATDRNYVALLESNGTLNAKDFAANGVVGDFLVQGDGKVVFSGSFTSFLGQTRNFLARTDASFALDTAFNPNPNSSVFSMALDASGKILIAGVFTGLQPNSTTYDPALATPRSRAARLNADGTVDPTFNPSFDGQVSGLVPAPDNTIVAYGGFTTIQPTGALVVGGSFSLINGVSVNNLALLSRDGSVSSTFLPNPNGAIYAVVPLTDGRLLVGGAFTSLAGQTRNRLARFLADDSLDTAFNPDFNGVVRAVVVQPDGKILVGGAFTSVGGAGRSYLARLNGNGSLDTSFAPAVSGEVGTVALQPDGRVLFTYATAGSANVLARVNADGSADSGFNPANNNRVNAIAVQASGHIVVGGSFTAIGGGSRSNFARLNANGTLDTSVNVTPDGTVTALSIQPDGKILIGGTFAKVDGLPRLGIARIAAPTAVAQSLTLSADRGTLTWTRSGGAAALYGALFETSTDNATWTTIGEGTRTSGSATWKLQNPSLPNQNRIFVRARGVTAVGPNSSNGVVLAQTQFYLDSLNTTQPPVFTSSEVVGGSSGATFSFALAASGQPTSYSATGLPAGLSLNAATGVISGTPTQTGSFVVTVTATNAGGTTTGTLTIIVSAAPQNDTGTSKLVNVSINGQVTATDPIIAGFVVGGKTSKKVLLRAVGPTLGDYGVANFLAEPRLQLKASDGSVIEQNSGWADNATLAAEFTRLGAGPLKAGSKDAALIVTLDPGVYTIHVASANGASGYAVAEVYDASDDFDPAWPRLVNLSGRSVVNDSGTVVTGGFVIHGKSARRVLIRGTGPGIRIAGSLADPVLRLYRTGSPTSTLIATNDNWGTPVTLDPTYPSVTAPQIAAAATAAGAGAFDTGSLDAALVVTLAPGVYTAQVGRNGSGTGSAMVEIYELDLPTP